MVLTFLQIPEKKELKGAFAQYKHEKLHITPTVLEEFELSITSVGVRQEAGYLHFLEGSFFQRR